jgi:hypothetical protein
MLALLDQIASVEDQPPIPPIPLIALLKLVFAHSDGESACDVDHGVLETIEYLELLEIQRVKRLKALEKRGGPLVADFVKTSGTAQSRFNFVLIGVKYWARTFHGEANYRLSTMKFQEPPSILTILSP